MLYQARGMRSSSRMNFVRSVTIASAPFVPWGGGAESVPASAARGVTASARRGDPRNDAPIARDVLHEVAPKRFSGERRACMSIGWASVASLGRPSR